MCRPETVAEDARRWSNVDRLAIATVDVRDLAATQAAIAGADVVISAIGSSGRVPDGHNAPGGWILPRADLARLPSIKSPPRDGAVVPQPLPTNHCR